MGAALRLIPQAPYTDVAAIVLGVEPDYAFDIPSDRWLWQWFLISLGGIMGPSLAVVLMARAVLKEKLTSAALPWLFWIVSFALGAAGTTVISKWQGDFVFTWPVSLFVTFQAAVSEIRLKAPAENRFWLRWRARLTILMFIVCCTGYYLLCRRLSLVFEWVFLSGFAAALPFAMAATHGFRERRWRLAWMSLMTAAAYASFYWSAVAVLKWKS